MPTPFKLAVRYSPYFEIILQRCSYNYMQLIYGMLLIYNCRNMIHYILPSSLSISFDRKSIFLHWLATYPCNSMHNWNNNFYCKNRHILQNTLNYNL